MFSIVVQVENHFYKMIADVGMAGWKAGTTPHTLKFILDVCVLFIKNNI